MKSLFKRITKLELRAHREGFDWMAGELLRGLKTVDELEAWHEAHQWDRNSFDNGAKEAVIAYRKLAKHSAKHDDSHQNTV